MGDGHYMAFAIDGIRCHQHNDYYLLAPIGSVALELLRRAPIGKTLAELQEAAIPVMIANYSELDNICCTGHNSGSNLFGIMSSILPTNSHEPSHLLKCVRNAGPGVFTRTDQMPTTSDGT